MEPEGDLQEPTYLTDDEARNIANSFYTSLHARYFSREDCYQNAAKLKDLYDKVVRTVRLCNDLCLSALKVCSDLKVLERSFKGDGTMIIKAGWCLAPVAEDPQIPKDMDDKTSLIAVCFQSCVRAIEILSPLVAYLLSPAGNGVILNETTLDTNECPVELQIHDEVWWVSGTHSMLRIMACPGDKNGILVDPTAPQFCDFLEEPRDLEQYLKDKRYPDDTTIRNRPFGSFLENHIQDFLFPTTYERKRDSYRTIIVSLTLSKAVYELVQEFGGVSQVWNLQTPQFDQFTTRVKVDVTTVLKEFRNEFDTIEFRSGREEFFSRLNEWMKELSKDHSQVMVKKALFDRFQMQEPEDALRRYLRCRIDKDFI